MKNLILVLLFTSICYSQNQKLGVVLDAENKKPIEFADVYNTSDNTITNENGKYFLLSNNDSITFYKLGYKTLKTTFGALADTIFLKEKTFELTEVVLTNEERLFDKVRKAVPENYPSEEYKERFFIRSTLRYDGDITRIQDIQGKLKRKTLLYHSNMELEKKDFVFEVENMRKVGLKDVTEDETDIYFRARSLREILTETIQLSIVTENFEIEEQYFDNQEKVRIAFTYNGENKKANNSGYYIIDLKDKAILEYYQLSMPQLDFKQKKDIKYRVTRFEKNVLFDKDLESGKYVMKNAKIKTLVELKDNEETFRTFFESEDILKSYGHFGSFKIRKNANETKEVFRLKFPYNKAFWASQNSLLLTDEMNAFITKVSKSDNEFDVRSNLD
ncbi:carboxypeptidase-like regulatory domain-containing protein [uncultured Croceitalea sp.]|uniref:carboxypeptidase-like regulatory domain-containing protein n=1 Tax=uncultured Croceitalea sp. TaxID=1798908 RepID=UPI00374FBE52